MAERVVIIGGSGRIGSELCRSWCEQGAAVRTLVRSRERMRTPPGTDIEVIEGDVRDPERVATAVQGADLVFHTAAVTRFWNPEEARRQEILDINVLGTRNVANACARAGVTRLIYTSTLLACAYSIAGSSINESSLWNWGDIDSIYLRSRLLAELEVLRAGAAGLTVNILNPSGVFGAPDHFLTEPSRILIDVVAGRLAVHFADTVLPSVTLDDIVAAHLAVARQGTPGRRYIVSGQNLPFDELFDEVERFIGRRLRRFPLSRRWITLLRPPAWLISRLAHDPFLNPAVVDLLAHPMVLDNKRLVEELGIDPLPVRPAIAAQLRWLADAGHLPSVTRQ